MLTLNATATPARRWVERSSAPFDAAAPAALQQALNLPPIICDLLARRGYAAELDARAFLKPHPDRLGDPYALAGMGDAVARILAAIDARETILVHGDYDVDGICAAALYTRVLRKLGARVEPFVPRRLVDGYDLGRAGVEAAAAAGASLILTGDCGIVAHDAIRAATAAGIDVVVTDHHTPGDALPGALAVVNPHRADCGYPDNGLCGAGVAFKVCQALARERGLPDDFLWDHLDLVGVATIADLVPLVGENRILARFGLRQLARTINPGLRALLETSGLAEAPQVGAGQVGHVLAPRINAVGRMSEAQRGVRLLLAEDAAEAKRIALELEDENRTRQEVDRQTLREAMSRLEHEYDPDRDWGIVLAGSGWHPGVIGIVASRIVEQLHRPTVLIALAEDGSLARGSARSIPGFHLYEALHACAHLLERYGGHRAAAGLDVRPERIDELREAFNAHAHAVLDAERLVPRLETDLDLRLPDANAELHRLLRHFGPFGVGNPTPVLVARGVGLARPPRVVGEAHLKLTLTQDRTFLPAIGFRMGERLREVEAAPALDVAFQLQENHWNGGVELQARLVDFRASETAG